MGCRLSAICFDQPVCHYTIMNLKPVQVRNRPGVIGNVPDLSPENVSVVTLTARLQ